MIYRTSGKWYFLDLKTKPQSRACFGQIKYMYSIKGANLQENFERHFYSSLKAECVESAATTALVDDNTAA